MRGGRCIGLLGGCASRTRAYRRLGAGHPHRRGALPCTAPSSHVCVQAAFQDVWGDAHFRLSTVDPLPADLVRRMRAAALAHAWALAPAAGLEGWAGDAPLSVALEQAALTRLRGALGDALADAHAQGAHLHDRAAVEAVVDTPLAATVLALHAGSVGVVEAALARADDLWLHLLHDGDAALFTPVAAAE